MSPRLVVFGLGNPGPKYADTRHNAGFRVTDLVASRHGAPRWEWGRSYLTTELVLDDTRVALVKPETFMNLSGRALVDYREGEGLLPGELLVVVDDIALGLGQLRLRRKGSDGGHNGLKSIISVIGTLDFARLRLGIGPVPEGEDPARFVLSPFSPGERPVVETMVGRAAACVESVVREGLDVAMNVFNVWNGDERDRADPGDDRP